MVDKGKRPDPLLPIDPELSSAAASQQPQQASFPSSPNPSLLPFILNQAMWLLHIVSLFLLPV